MGELKLCSQDVLYIESPNKNVIYIEKFYLHVWTVCVS